MTLCITSALLSTLFVKVRNLFRHDRNIPPRASSFSRLTFQDGYRSRQADDATTENRNVTRRIRHVRLDQLECLLSIQIKVK
ncbi:hypothetical protein PHSY_004689 [Pseudozyma hubeiensis SY62]|uniref:Uncharacterized protein n=1 Tax=Pseudozyma hubeiensis (strain SY62) TaxID=1305764 RepID=R9PG62_PSEHS|nr:hypothetical protein PHSY_004689 [Pseudozyma hubeiensis SY62]GAC97105.1 hypothetical protein PHSY_004689 [Pseudozyma hubeiensis SY62]